jgi:hypothetical protein
MVVTLASPIWPLEVSMTRGITLAAVALVLILSACRTAAPAQRATESMERASAGVVYVPLTPEILVARDEYVFLLLHASAAVLRPGAQSYEVAYVASMDVSLARTEDAPYRAAGTAAFLLDVIAPVLPPDVTEADVTAVFGAPGTWGLGISTHAVRGGDRWATAQKGAVHPVLVPPLPNQLTRPTRGERAATGAARAFLERADVEDRDAVWDLTSAAVKATTSRRSFEQAHWPDGWKARQSARREQFREYAVHTGEFKVGDILQVCFVSDGSVDAVQVRLDDDQEWRISDFARRPTVAARRAPTALDASSPAATSRDVAHEPRSQH